MKDPDEIEKTPDEAFGVLLDSLQSLVEEIRDSHCDIEASEALEAIALAREAPTASPERRAEIVAHAKKKLEERS